ncbi:MAG TPA: polysaccharide deacetylase family protein [Devosia sp.]|nr:polysaccharide deacetylase family protein [Devosia sp.]
MRRRDFLVACACAACAGGARANGLVEPHMRFDAPRGTPQVALTLDACMGETDERLLGPLIDNAIRTTLFVTKRWLDGNGPAVALIARHRDLFSVENHGAMHVPAVIGTERPYGIAPAGTTEAVRDEVLGGSDAIVRAFGTAPRWYRDATALYSLDAIALIEELGFRVAGFSLNGDFGASASAETAHQNIAESRSGDVVIAHINQPHRAAGAGVISGILALKARGHQFVHLDDLAMKSVA